MSSRACTRRSSLQPAFSIDGEEGEGDLVDDDDEPAPMHDLADEEAKMADI